MRWLLAVLLMLAGLAARAETLPLKAYLDQVKRQHKGVQGAELASEGAAARTAEADLPYSPQFFTNVSYLYDQRPVLQPAFQPNLTRATQLSVGVQKQFGFGLTAKLAQNLTATRLSGASPQFLPLPNYVDFSPSLELSQPLWRNGFGAEARAQSEALEASLQATRFAEAYRVKALLAGAENVYWRLSLARETLEIQRDSLERARRIRQWAARRTRLDLADKADLLQAEAALRLREFELKTVEEDMRQASRQFNLARGLDSDRVAETLEPLMAGASLSVPRREGMREDVKAAEARSRAAVAATEAGKQKTAPTLDLVANLSLHGRDPSLSPAFEEAYGDRHPYGYVGVRFTAPLDFGGVEDSRSGYEKERQAAELNYSRQVLEQESEWRDLVRQFEERKERLALVREIEAAQRTKVEHERVRLRRGKTTTYQVLLFEEDYAGARRTRLRLEAELLSLSAQMKTFEGGGHESR